MKKRNNLLAALGLAGILGASWYFNKNSPKIEKAEESPATEVTSNKNIAKNNKKAREQFLIVSRPHSQEEKDEFRDYIANLEIVPPILYKTDEKCDINKLTAGYTKEHKSFAELKTNNEHILWKALDHLINIDVNLANCLHKLDRQRSDYLLKEAAGHYEYRGSYGSAGRLYYFLGDKNKARKNFRKDPLTLEALIKFTPPEELNKLKEAYLTRGGYLEAGKIAWYQGDREKGREYIAQSERYKELIENCSNFIDKGNVRKAIFVLWEFSRIPFYKEALLSKCKNEKCKREIENYIPNSKSNVIKTL
ncbi:MAG: hypothetical protein AABX13_06155 [Nanoarchaeota archaeon]